MPLRSWRRCPFPSSIIHRPSRQKSYSCQSLAFLPQTFQEAAMGINLNVSPVTGEQVPDHYLHSSSVHFQDTHGRSILLRGVNLSGSAKQPIGAPSWKQEGFWEDAEEGKLDFRGRPFDLEDGSADVSLIFFPLSSFSQTTVTETCP